MHELGTPQITVNAENGTAIVEAYPTCGNDTATVSATADSNYHFVGWSDGSTQNPYTLVLTGNTTLTAIFAIDSVLVRATPANPLKGAVMGGGVVPINSTTTLTAIPSGSNVFLTWSNGVTDNPYTLTATSDTTLQAYFTLPDTLIFRDTINHYIHDTTFVNNYVHDTMIQFVNQYIHDTTYINNYIHDTVRITTQLLDTTIMNVYHFDTAIYNTCHFDTLIVNNHYYDTVYITTHHYDTIYFADTLVFYDTTSVTHYVFDSTWVYDSVWVFDSVYVTDTVYFFDTVYIEVPVQGIDGVEIVNVKVYTHLNRITVEGAQGMAVRLYDVNGRLLATKVGDSEMTNFYVQASGAYLVRVNDYPARRVVVIM